MGLIINETSSGPELKHTVTKTANLNESVEVVSLDVKEGHPVVISSSANYAPAGPPGPAGSTIPNLGSQVPIGSYFQLTRSDNGSSSFGAVAGREYAVGIALGPCTIDLIGIQVHAVGDAGSTFRIGLRPVASDGVIGAPVMDVEFDASTSGVKWSNIPATELEGLYTLSWVSIRSSGVGPSMQRATFERNTHLTPFAWAPGFPATGHGPVHAILNEGISGALPNSLAPLGVGTNQEGGRVPQVVLRRSA